MPLSPEPVRPALARVFAEASLVGLSVFAYLWLWRLYGFDLVDEGTQLLQISRVAGGALPYTDFETGYTPGYFAFEAWLMHLGGFAAIRTFGVVLQAAVAATLYGLLREFGGVYTAVGGVAVLVAFLLPVSLSTGAPSNIPYPGWLALPAVVAAAGLLARLAERRPPGRVRTELLLVGVASGIAFAFKPNTGVFVLGGAALASAATWRSTRLGERILCWSLRFAAVAALFWLLRPTLGSRLGLALLTPALLAVLVAGPLREGDRRGSSVDLLYLSGGFLLVTLPWLVPLAARIGIDGVIQKVLFFGSSARTVVDAYILAAPEFQPGMLVLAGGFAAAMFLGGTRAARLAPWALALGCVASMPFAQQEGILSHSENVLFWSGPIALVLGLVTIGSGAARLRERILLIFASFLLLTLYPRPDLIHVAQIGPVILLAGLATWHRAVRAWRHARRVDGETSAVAPWLVAGFFLALAFGRVAPTLLPRLSEPLVSTKLGPEVTVQVLEERAPDYQALARLVAEIRAETGRGDPVFTFPDLGGLAFLAQRPSPFYYVYFIPGRPDHVEVARVREEWRRFRPVLALIGRPQVPAFAASSEYFSDLLAFVYGKTSAGRESGGIELRPSLR